MLPPAKFSWRLTTAETFDIDFRFFVAPENVPVSGDEIKMQLARHPGDDPVMTLSTEDGSIVVDDIDVDVTPPLIQLRFSKAQPDDLAGVYEAELLLIRNQFVAVLAEGTVRIKIAIAKD